ncbi:hypothetical protein D7Y11_08205 [Corallococcus sp. AB018]|uniref:hypothetical protein n=1 Tax=unclassified Corallococcus TaxID=2685029 RepID=UPI000EA0A29B|nr:MULTISPECIES: hypothetical protein [unclassified Corallococcus]RKH21889.1 hypothetical protein D7V77_28785 [Corallococcus sp. CA041A]RUO93677.1 hypothetical protein D7Y11_08205 [Corallococcus sp. AB018]
MSTPTPAPYTPPPELIASAEKALAQASPSKLALALMLYHCYGSVTGGRSAVTGAELRPFEKCSTLVRAGWLAVAETINTTAARHRLVAEREAALTELYQMPRLQRVVAQKLAGYERGPGAEPAARTVAQELRLSEDEVLRLHRQALKRMREALDAKGLGPELPARVSGKLRQRRAAAPRDVRPRPVGQGAQMGLALPAVESRRPSAWGA